MNDSINMQISSLTRSGDNKAVYVLFTEKDKMVEFALPGAKILRNKGFEVEELQQLRDYLVNEQDYIYSMAKQVNPLKNFLDL